MARGLGFINFSHGLHVANDRVIRTTNLARRTSRFEYFDCRKDSRRLSLVTGAVCKRPMQEREMSRNVHSLADFRERIPTQEEISSAAAALTAIEQRRNSDGTLGIDEVCISASLVDLITDVFSIIARGDTLTLAPLSRQLTTQEAADLLNVSRPYLIKLIDNGQLRCTYTGTHRRLSLGEILEYKTARSKGRSAALQDLQDIAEDLDED